MRPAVCSVEGLAAFDGKGLMAFDVEDSVLGVEVLAAIEVGA